MIQEIKSSQQDISTVRNTQSKEKQAPVQSVQEQEKAKNNTDTVELGKSANTSTLYTRPRGKLKADDIDALMEHAEKTLEGFRNLVRQMLLKQGEAAGKHKPETIELPSANEAGLAISEDGEFGVKAVSDKIVNFAISVADNDPAKLAELKDAIEKGFAAAEKTFGGKLPDICYQTHDEIMKKLDKWSEDAKVEA
jgi:hypothetical protein